MRVQSIVTWRINLTAALTACATVLTGCTQEEADAVLAGVQVVADELIQNSDDEVSFRDWLSSELDD
jgi:hypothetical protein